MKYKITFEFDTDVIVYSEPFLRYYNCELGKLIEDWGETPLSFLQDRMRDEDLEVSMGPVVEQGEQ